MLLPRLDVGLLNCPDAEIGLEACQSWPTAGTSTQYPFNRNRKKGKFSKTTELFQKKAFFSINLSNMGRNIKTPHKTVKIRYRRS